MRNHRIEEDVHIDELTDRVAKIKRLGVSLDDDIRRDSTMLDAAGRKADALRLGLGRSVSDIGTMKKHEWLKAGKLLIFIIFVFALSCHYLNRIGVFSMVARFLISGKLDINRQQKRRYESG